MKKNKVLKRLCAIGLCACLALTVGCGNQASTKDAASTSDDMRKYEGTTLNVSLAYGGADKSFQEFEDLTGIKVNSVAISSGKTLAKLEAENGESTSDIWFGGGVDAYLKAADAGWLLQYDSPNRKDINDAYKDDKGYWTGLSLVPTGFLVNKDVMAEKGFSAPERWEDLTKPEYKDELIMASPAISGTQYAILNGTIQALGEEEGWKLWEGINNNVDYYAQGGGEPAPKCGQGEYGVAVLAMAGGTFKTANEFNCECVFPQDMIPWTPAPIAIFKSTKNADAAKLFVDWYLSKEGQTSLCKADPRIMTRDDVEVPEQLRDLDKSKLISQDLTKFASQRSELLEKWDAMTQSK